MLHFVLVYLSVLLRLALAGVSLVGRHVDSEGCGVCCSMLLQYVAVCCSMLQCDATFGLGGRMLFLDDMSTVKAVV